MEFSSILLNYMQVAMRNLTTHKIRRSYESVKLDGQDGAMIAVAFCPLA